jgi:hypothetical protein
MGCVDLVWINRMHNKLMNEFKEEEKLKYTRIKKIILRMKIYTVQE